MHRKSCTSVVCPCAACDTRALTASLVRHNGSECFCTNSRGCDTLPVVVSGHNSDPTGSAVYDAAICLCWWLESESGRVMVPLAGRVVVELGAGTGVVGLASTRLGAHYVWMTDGEPASVTMCRANLAIEAATDAAKAMRSRLPDGDDALRAGAQQLLWGAASGGQLGRLLRSRSAPQHEQNGGGGVVLAADVRFIPLSNPPVLDDRTQTVSQTGAIHAAGCV